MRNANSFALAGLVWAALAVPSAVSALEGGAPAIQLVAPRAGAALAAGSTAELEWAPAGKLGAGIEEWEAFLSVDGGKTYPVRITPHLDQDLRRITWQVPSTPTPDARLLLRFGDEREGEEEVSVELPHRYSIVPSPAGATGFTLPSVAPERGEPALPGQDGVVAWVEGSRRGGEQRQMVAAERPRLQARLSLPETRSETAVLTTEEAPLQVPQPVRGSAADAPPSNRGSPLTSPGETPAPPSDILLLIQRQNE